MYKRQRKGHVSVTPEHGKGWRSFPWTSTRTVKLGVITFVSQSPAKRYTSTDFFTTDTSKILFQLSSISLTNIFWLSLVDLQSGTDWSIHQEPLNPYVTNTDSHWFNNIKPHQHWINAYQNIDCNSHLLFLYIIVASSRKVELCVDSILSVSFTKYWGSTERC